MYKKNCKILNALYNARADELAEENTIPVENTQKFLDIVSNIENEDLRQKLISCYLKDEDLLSGECARLMKKYYFNGCSDMLSLVIECTEGGGEK